MFNWGILTNDLGYKIILEKFNFEIHKTLKVKNCKTIAVDKGNVTVIYKYLGIRKKLYLIIDG